MHFFLMFRFFHICLHPINGLCGKVYHTIGVWLYICMIYTLSPLLPFLCNRKGVFHLLS